MWTVFLYPYLLCVDLLGELFVKVTGPIFFLIMFVLVLIYKCSLCVLDNSPLSDVSSAIFFFPFSGLSSNSQNFLS